MLTKCGCAIYVHLQLDLLKFYLAILKKNSRPPVCVCRFTLFSVILFCYDEM